MHVPCPEGGDAPSARRSLLSGKCFAVCFKNKDVGNPSLFLCHQQKMDKNKDGVVTIDEFIDCCQNVSWILTNLHCLAVGLNSAFFMTLSLFILRMKTSCDQCTSLKMFSNSWLPVEAFFGREHHLSHGPITDLDSYCVQCAMQTFDHR